MNDIKAVEALAEVLRNEDRTILQSKVDYLNSALGLCVLTVMACIAVYLITIV
jgi:hypothetical protein